MKAWLAAHIFACERAGRRFMLQPIGAIFSVLVIGISIALPLALFSLFTNVSLAAGRIGADPNVNLYFTLDATEAEAAKVEKRVRANPNVRSARIVTRETALTEMKRVGNLTTLLSSLESNPLPHALSIVPTSTDPAMLATLRAELSALPKVEHVVMDFEWAQKLKRFAAFAERLTLLLGLILGVAVLFVSGNTIRLQILTQKDEIEVSRLIGATRRFVRRPFLYFGASQGFLAGVVALVLVGGFVMWAGAEVQALTVSYGSEFALQSPTFSHAIGVVLGSTALGWLGAFFSVWRYLRREQVDFSR